MENDLRNPVWRFGVAVAREPLPVGFATLENHNECCNLLSQMTAAQALDAHPSWERGGNDTYKRRWRAGPKTIEMLKAWFERNHPERVEHITEAIRRAVHVKHGLVPPKTS